MNYFDNEFYRGKRVLVTGHTGFKGSWLCRILINAGAVVTGYSQNPRTNPNLFSLAGLEENMHSIIGDIRDISVQIPVEDLIQLKLPDPIQNPQFTLSTTYRERFI